MWLFPILLPEFFYGLVSTEATNDVMHERMHDFFLLAIELSAQTFSACKAEWQEEVE